MAPGSAGGRRLTTAERRKIRAAYETGIVESGLRNLSYGDADSAGWRQERASLYPNPTNVPASVRRFFNETDQLYRGQSAGRLAADVQRPAAQYRGRYAEHRDEAIRLLRKNVLGASPPSGAPGGGSARRTGSGALGGVSAALGAVPAPSSALEDPEFSARRHLRFPEGSKDVQSSGPPVPGDSLGSLVAKSVGSAPSLRGQPQLSPGLGRLAQGVPAPRFTDVASARGRTITTPGGKRYRWTGSGWLLVRDPKDPGYRGDGKPDRPEFGSRSGGHPLGAPLDRPGARTRPVVRRFVRNLAGVSEFPIRYGTGTAHSKYTKSGNISEHWDGTAIDLPMTGRQLRIAMTKALRLVGVDRNRARQMAFQGGIWDIPYKGRRYQIIGRTDDHWDHLHVGIGR